jgi:predicted DNA binding protein
VTDLVQRLRDSVTQARAIDRAALLHEAADEIEQLRSYAQSDEKRRDSDTSGAPLTDAERKAIREACDEGRWWPKDYHHIHTLRGLLKRLG